MKLEACRVAGAKSSVPILSYTASSMCPTGVGDAATCGGSSCAASAATDSSAGRVAEGARTGGRMSDAATVGSVLGAEAEAAAEEPASTEADGGGDVSALPPELSGGGSSPACTAIATGV